MVPYLVPFDVLEGDMAITATEARKNLFPLIRQVNEDHVTVEIVSKGGNAVLVSKEDWDALEETAYLLRSPVMARRLTESLDRVRRGEVTERELIDE